MTREELLDPITEVQDPQSELAGGKARAVRAKMPRRLYEPLSAFANPASALAGRLGLAHEHPERPAWRPYRTQRRMGGAR